jgi:chemotaxis protein methyltransferase CheR
MVHSVALRASVELDDVDHLGKAQFDRLAQMINDRTGIQLPPSKRTMLETRLQRRLRVLGFGRLDDYFRHVSDPANRDEIEHLINAVTTNKTDFFREPAHFEALAGSILPAYVAQGRRHLRIWSAAASIGAEAYTIAMVCDNFLRTQRGPGFDILATDIDTQVLETARRGIFPASMLDPVPAHLRGAYVMQPRTRGRDDVRIAPDLRAQVSFARLNLIEGPYPLDRPMDVIFCRNVLIYFNRATQAKVVSQLVDALAPGGYLFLGHSEGGAGTDPRLTQVAGTMYQRCKA